MSDNEFEMIGPWDENKGTIFRHHLRQTQELLKELEVRVVKLEAFQASMTTFTQDGPPPLLAQVQALMQGMEVTNKAIQQLAEAMADVVLTTRDNAAIAKTNTSLVRAILLALALLAGIVLVG